MNDYFEDKLRSLDESRPAELAVMSTTDVVDILRAQLPLPDTSLGEPEKLVLRVLKRNSLSMGVGEQKHHLQ